MDQRGQQADPQETRCLLGITGTGASATWYGHAVTAIHALRGAAGGSPCSVVAICIPECLTGTSALR